MARLVGKVVQFQHMGGPTDELHPFTKSSEAGLGLSTDSTALLSGNIRQVSMCLSSNSLGIRALVASTPFSLAANLAAQRGC